MYLLLHCYWFCCCCYALCRDDSFTAGLLKVLRDSRAARAAMASAGKPALSLGIHRSDYMLDAPSGGFLQVGRYYRHSGPTRNVDQDHLR